MAQQPEVDSAPQEVDSAPQADAKPKKKPNPLILVIILAVVGVVIWRVFFAGPSVPPGIVALSGRIEGDDSAVAPKTTGRVLEVRVREGDQVNAGDVIAVLDDQQIKDRQDQAQAALAAAQARTTAATAQVAVLEQQLKQAQLTAIQSNDDAQGRVGQAEADPAKSYEGGECQESRQQPERWAAEVRPDHERQRVPRPIECIRERILTSDPERFQLRSRACACRFRSHRLDPNPLMSSRSA